MHSVHKVKRVRVFELRARDILLVVLVLVYWCCWCSHGYYLCLLSVISVGVGVSSVVFCSEFC